VISYYLLSVFSLILMSITSYTDLKKREISNYAVLAGIVFGLVYWTVLNQLPGLGYSVLGGITGFTIFFLLALLGNIGFGDVKLVAAMGFLLSWPLVLTAIFHVVISGFFLALIWVGISGNLLRTFKNLWILVYTWLRPGKKRVSLDKLETSSLPYGLAIAAGTWWTLAAQKWPQFDLMQWFLH
jgi:prepilin peptidase CpaA